MTSVCATLGNLSFKECGLPEYIYVGCHYIGHVTFIASGILALTSGFQYFYRYGYLIVEKDEECKKGGKIE